MRFLKLMVGYGAPDLTGAVVRVARPRPRNVTAQLEERAKLLAAAPPHLRCWILMCSDLAIRSGTAAKLGPEHYNPEKRTLTFTTKLGERQVLPVTSEIAALLETPRLVSGVPFIAQLPRGTHARLNRPIKVTGKLNPHRLRNQFAELRRSLGINRQVTLHDLRRTTARAVYERTHDLPTAQALLGHTSLESTLWYLQDALVTVDVSVLELVKLNTPTETIQ